MYLKSVAGSDGVLQMTVTFRPGTNADDAAVRVQNRVAQALARLPEDVRRQGVTTQKQSPMFLMVVHLVSPNGKYDTLYLRNYCGCTSRTSLARLPGVGDAQHVRRRRLCDARLAGSGQGRLARPDRGRRRARHPRAEHPGLGRPARRRADADGQRLPDARSMRRAACARPRSSATSCSRPAMTARSCAWAMSRASSSPPATTRCVRAWTAWTRPPSASSRRPAPMRCRSATRWSRRWTS